MPLWFCWVWGFFSFYCSKFQNALLPMRRISEKAQVTYGWVRNFWNKVDWIPKSRSHRNEISVLKDL